MALAKEIVIIGLPPIKQFQRGRPPRVGRNQTLLAKIKPGDVNSCLLVPTKERMLCIVQCARNSGMKVKVRQWPDENGKATGEYGIWRET